MPTLPATMITVLSAFAPLFSPRVWRHAQVLLVGAILAPAQRTVAAALRVTGHAQVRQFHRYHRVLSRAEWSGPGHGSPGSTATRTSTPALPTAASGPRRCSRPATLLPKPSRRQESSPTTVCRTPS
jgi:hypothetical protein